MVILPDSTQRGHTGTALYAAGLRWVLSATEDEAFMVTKAFKKAKIPSLWTGPGGGQMPYTLWVNKAIVAKAKRLIRSLW